MQEIVSLYRSWVLLVRRSVQEICCWRSAEEIVSLYRSWVFLVRRSFAGDRLRRLCHFTGAGYS